MATPKITDVSNPAAIGLEWVSAEGTRYQIVYLRWTDHLSLGVKGPGGRWQQNRITNPDYAVTADTSGVDVRLIMRRFIAAGSE